MIAWARQNPWVRLALAALGGLLAGVALYAWNKHLDKRHRREIAGVGAFATAIIIWLLLGSQAVSSAAEPLPDINIGGSSVPAVNLGSLGPVTFSGSLDFGGYNPSVIFQNPTPPQAMSLCGCSERADAWGNFIAQLWAALDQVAPEGPVNVAPETNLAPANTGVMVTLPAPATV